MISARTCGRLGNFLFQFAATYCHAKKNGFDYCMPSKSMNERLWPTPKFKNIKYCSQQPGKLFVQPSAAYHPIPDEDNLILEGFWQSEKYWHGLHNEIAEILEFEYRPTNYVSVHVRRGDYLRFPDEFPVLPMEYYLSAFQYLKESGYTKFDIFSDDIKWCMNFFMSERFLEYEIQFSCSNHPIGDMWEMYNGSAIIIANSTFSLFPALLRSDNPIVIAPKEERWFGKNAQRLVSNDRVPERFIKM